MYRKLFSEVLALLAALSCFGCPSTSDANKNTAATCSSCPPPPCPSTSSSATSATTSTTGGAGATGPGEEQSYVVSNTSCAPGDVCSGTTDNDCTTFNGCDTTVGKCKVKFKLSSYTCMTGEAIKCNLANGNLGVYLCGADCRWPSSGCQECGKRGMPCCLGVPQCVIGTCSAGGSGGGSPTGVCQ